jgi:hypothetical protein
MLILVPALVHAEATAAAEALDAAGAALLDGAAGTGTVSGNRLP